MTLQIKTSFIFWTIGFVLHTHQCLAAAPGEAVNDLLEKTTHQISLLHVTTTPYWDRLVKRFTPEYSDSSGVQEMMQAQQRWRRSAAWDKGTSNAAKKDLDPYDCVPTFKVRKSVTQWFHVRTLEVGLCFSLCVDYPRCSTTTPLVQTHAHNFAYKPSNTTGDFSALYAPGTLHYCGIQGFDHNPDQIVDVRGRAVGGNGSKPVCTNVVDRVAGLRGVTVKQVEPPSAPAGSSRSGLTVTAYMREGRSYDEELTIYTADLWSHWRIPLLSLLRLGTPSRDGNLFLAIASHNDADLRKVVAGVGAGTPPVRVVDALWVITPDVKKYMHASYNVMRPDMGGRWYTFVYYGRAEPAPTVENHLNDVNGWCKIVLQKTLLDASRGINTSQPAQAAPYCSHLQRAEITSESDVGDSWANGGTVFFPPQQRVNNRCPVILDTNASNIAWIAGCDGETAALGLNQFAGDVCQGVNLFTTPLIESRVHTGNLESTYTDGWRVFVEVMQLPPATCEKWFIGSSELSEEDPGYFMLADASGQCNTSRVMELQRWELQQVEDIVREAGIPDRSEGAIIVGFTQLFIATVTMIMMWGPTTQEAAMAFIDKFVDKVQHCCHRVARRNSGPVSPCPRVKMVLLLLLRFIVAAAIFGPALFGFISVTAQGTGTTFVEGYPTLRFLEIAPAPCSNARTGHLGLGITRVATSRIDMQTWAVVVVCVVMGVALIGATLLTTRMIASLDSKSNAASKAQPSRPKGLQPMRSTSP